MIVFNDAWRVSLCLPAQSRFRSSVMIDLPPGRVHWVLLHGIRITFLPIIGYPVYITVTPIRVDTWIDEDHQHFSGIPLFGIGGIQQIIQYFMDTSLRLVSLPCTL